MHKAKRCALLDTDFISKLYITKASASDRFLFRILEISDFHFVCHQQTSIELARHNEYAAKYLHSTEKIAVYTDRQLILQMEETFHSAAYILYMDMLRRSCEIFSQSFFETHYFRLEEYINAFWNNYDLEKFLQILSSCDDEIGQDNNLGEIKLYTMAQILEKLGTEELYYFCSDDQKARYALSGQADMECISALAAFYLAKKYLKMEKSEAQVFFDSWMQFHQACGQSEFKLYSASGHHLEKADGQNIFDLLYRNELYLMRDGFFRRK